MANKSGAKSKSKEISMVDRKYKKSQRSMIESQKGGNQDKDRKDL